MANVRVPTTPRNNMLKAIRDLVDAGAGAGVVEIRSGTQPASANDAASGTLLAAVPLADPCAPDPAGGVLTFDCDPDIEDVAADADGVATWARIKDSAGNTVFDCDVGLTAATIIINTVNIVTGGPVRITDFTLTQPAG